MKVHSLSRRKEDSLRKHMYGSCLQTTSSFCSLNTFCALASFLLLFSIIPQSFRPVFHFHWSIFKGAREQTELCLWLHPELRAFFEGLAVLFHRHLHLRVLNLRSKEDPALELSLQAPTLSLGSQK